MLLEIAIGEVIFLLFDFKQEKTKIFVGKTTLNQILFSLVFLCKVVAAPIQVQFTSNSSPIGNWKSIVYALYLRFLCSNSALFLNKQKVKRFALHLLFFTNCLICLDVSRKKSNFALIKSETCVSLYWATMFFHTLA